MSDLARLDWLAIAKAYLVSFVVAVAIGLAFGTFGIVLLFAAGEESIAAVTEGIGLKILGMILSLIPVLIGSASLAGFVYDDVRKHCLVFGIVSLVLAVGFDVVLGDWSFSWHHILVYVAIVPTAMVGWIVGEHL